MKKATTIFSIALLILVFSSAIEKVQKSAGPPSCHAGEPPNGATCLECHNDGTLNAGSAEVLLDLGGADTNYVPGKIYTITVRVFKPGMRRAGFQCIALRDDDDKASPGKVTLSDAARTQVLDKNIPHSGGCPEEERVWIEHTYDGNSSNDSGVSSWSYLWRAPGAPAGSITFYVAALEANNDLAETGDQVYTRKKTIVGLPVGIKEVTAPEEFRIYPVPARGELQIAYTNRQPRKVTLYTVAGREVTSWESFLSGKEKEIVLDLGELGKGMYILDIQTDDGMHALRKMMLR